MRVFIAEKPALAQVIAEALGDGQRKGGYIQCGDDVVTWCIGHLLELCPPEVYNPDYAQWNVAHLPLQMRPARYQPIEKTRDQFQVVAELVSKASEIVHAGDPDDEGQLLVDEVLVYCGNSRPVKRVLINDLNVSAARKALQVMRDNVEFQGLSNKALARSIGDQWYGFNLTRACTLAARVGGVKGVLSVGRVQTPILGLIVNRYLTNTQHSSAFYYNVSAKLDIGGGQVNTRLVVPADAPVDDKGRLIDLPFAQGLAERCSQQVAAVVQASVQDKAEQAPLPFALLELQVHMSQVHDIDAEKTLALTQALREKHKAITYNRSDCRYLSSDQFAEAPLTLKLLSQALPDRQPIFAQLEASRKSRAFNDGKITAHTAIIPTAVKVDLGLLSDDERKVYLAIVDRYLAQFLPDRLSLQAQAEFEVAGQRFKARAKRVTHPGWALLVADQGTSDEDDGEAATEQDGPFELLARLKAGDQGRCQAVAIDKQKTKPLPLYTEATLLQDLKRVAKYVRDPRIKQLLLDRDQEKADEHGGIGTSATRGAMLAKLQERGFYKTEKKKLIPTPLGLAFIAALPAIATTPDMTALWHEQQRMIEAGELTVDAFLDGLETFIGEQVRNLDMGTLPGEPAPPKVTARCPMCGGELASTAKLVACKGCPYRIYPEIAGKKLTAQQLDELLTKGRTSVIKGFKGKTKAFDAALRLNSDGKAEFVFNR